MTFSRPQDLVPLAVKWISHFVNFSFGYASAISWVLFLIIMAVSLVQLRLLRYRDVD